MCWCSFHWFVSLYSKKLGCGSRSARIRSLGNLLDRFRRGDADPNPGDKIKIKTGRLKFIIFLLFFIFSRLAIKFVKYLLEILFLKFLLNCLHLGSGSGTKYKGSLTLTRIRIIMYADPKQFKFLLYFLPEIKPFKSKPLINYYTWPYVLRICVYTVFWPCFACVE